MIDFEDRNNHVLLYLFHLEMKQLFTEEIDAIETDQCQTVESLAHTL